MRLHTLTVAALASAVVLAGCASHASWFPPGGGLYGRIAKQTHSRAAPLVQGAQHGGKVYDVSECVGPVIMGRCQGSIIPNKAYHPTCYGTWLNGQCTGPLF